MGEINSSQKIHRVITNSGVSRVVTVEKKHVVKVTNASAQGADGPQGPPGQGVPTGGTTGQVMKKQSATDYDIAWEDESGGGGTGDVVGPASSVDDNLAAFDGVTGKLIKDSGAATSDVTANTAARHSHTNKAELDLVTDGDHDVRIDNPHSTTKAHVGLGSVPNLDTTDAVANEHTHSNKAELDLITDAGSGVIISVSERSKLTGIEAGAQVNTVDSVNTQTGAVVLDTDDVNEGTTNYYYTEARVSANTDVAANTSARHSHTNKAILDLITDAGSGIIMSATERSKLAGIESGAQVNTVDSVNGSTGVVVLDTDDISQGSTNLYFSEAPQDGNTYGRNNAAWVQVTGSGAVDSVFGRTGAVVAQANDYTWAQIDKTVSDIADIATRSHTDLTDIGTNNHTAIDSHIANVSNPHSVTKTQVNLGSVIDELQVSSESNVWGTDYADKASPASGDYIVIEDSADSYNKKRINVGNLPTGGGGEVNTASNQGTGVGVFWQKVGVDLQFNNFKSENDRLSISLDGVSHDIEFTLNEGNIVHQNLSGAGTNNHTQIDSHIANTSNPHSVLATQITDFDTEVSNNADVAANTTDRHTHSNKAELDLITDAGSGIIISASERSKLAGIETGAQVNIQTFADDQFRVFDNADNTKLVAFELSGVTTATVRTLTVPDADGTIALLSDIPAVPVTSVFSRTGDVVAATNDYTWAQIDKTTSDIADIADRSHTDLTDIGTNDHAAIDTHLALVNEHIDWTSGGGATQNFFTAGTGQFLGAISTGGGSALGTGATATSPLTIQDWASNPALITMANDFNNTTQIVMGTGLSINGSTPSIYPHGTPSIQITGGLSVNSGAFAVQTSNMYFDTNDTYTQATIYFGRDDVPSPRYLRFDKTAGTDGEFLFSHPLQTNTIRTLDDGKVTIVNDLHVDVVKERTTDAGVTIDGLLIKDGAIPGYQGSANVLRFSGQGVPTEYAATADTAAARGTALTSAIAAASSGETVYVRAGTYDAHLLLKNGVNLYFAPGAVVTYTGATTGAIFDDQGSAVTAVIDGFGEFTHSGTVGNRQVVNITDEDSDITIYCKKLDSTNSVAIRAGASSAGTGQIIVYADEILSSDGTLDNVSNDMPLIVHARRVYSSNSYAVELDGGSIFVKADTIESGLQFPITIGSGGSFEIWNAKIIAPAGKDIIEDTVGAADTARLFNCELDSDQTDISNSSLTTSNCFRTNGNEITVGGTLTRLGHEALVNEHIDWTDASQDLQTSGNAIFDEGAGNGQGRFDSGYRGWALDIKNVVGGWARGYYFFDDVTELGGFYGFGSTGTLTRMGMSTGHSDEPGVHFDITNTRVGIHTTTPGDDFEVVGDSLFTGSGLMTGSFEITDTALADKTSLLVDADITVTSGFTDTTHRALDIDYDIIINSGGIPFNTFGGYRYTFDATDNGASGSGLDLQPIYIDIDPDELTLSGIPIEINFTNPATAQGFTSGFMCLTVRGGTGTTIGLASNAECEGAGNALGFKGYAAGFDSATGYIVGIQGFAFGSTGSNHSYMAALDGVVTTGGNTPADKRMGLRAQFHALIRGGSVFITDNSADTSPNGVTTSHVDPLNNTGELYVEQDAEIDGELFMDGNRSDSVETVTTTHTAGDETVILANATTAAFTITLPAVSGLTGRTYKIIKTDSSSNRVTIDGNASETINGVANKRLTRQFDGIELICTGSAWVSTKFEEPSIGQYMHYTKTSGGNQNIGGSGGTTTDITWETNLHLDPIFSVLGEEIELGEAGRYQVIATVGAEQGGSARTTIGLYINLDGTDNKKCMARNYSRGSGYGDISCNIITEIEASSGDILIIRTLVDDTDGVYTINTVETECEVIVRRIA